MLTGDKGETAKNIAISCGLIDLKQHKLFKIESYCK
jgi:magnesium-transporting ATPase (P-type)